MREMESFPWQTFSVASAGWILVAVFVTAMWRGMVVPRQSLDDVIHDRNEWRAESRIKDTQIQEKDEQLRHLAEVGETQKAVLTSISRLADRGDQP